MSEWISVKSIKDVPNGDWLVKTDGFRLGLNMHTASVAENVAFVGGLFSYDQPNVTAYQPLPSPPQECK